MTILENFTFPIRAVIVGASGGIGNALTQQLLACEKTETVYMVARSNPNIAHDKATWIQADMSNEENIQDAARAVKQGGAINLVIVATGFLHDENHSPEKTIKTLSFDALSTNFTVNCFGPAMIAKHFLPLIDRQRPSVFAALSARVGSISDNRLGGWYAYRASKAALNMVLKTLSIEFARSHKMLTILGLHPGTVDTNLSEPFQGNVPGHKLFTPDFSASKILEIIDGAQPQQSGLLYAWDGELIPF